MATFVHLTPEKNLKSILRNGITRLTQRRNGTVGVYASPITQNFYASHQWLRELKRRNAGPIVAIYLRIPDETLVLVGRFSETHLSMTAAEAIATVMQCEYVAGFEVIIPRKIARAEIHHVRAVPQVIGWRYYPEAHGKKPCGCPYCQRGEYGGRKLRERYEQEG
ncbi:MAG: hypothetical protein U0175_20240 [Caldilineaceae bacterium]